VFLTTVLNFYRLKLLTTLFAWLVCFQYIWAFTFIYRQRLTYSVALQSLILCFV